MLGHSRWMGIGIGIEIGAGGRGSNAVLPFQTTKQNQSWTIAATAGAPYRLDWGDGTSTVITGNGGDQTVTHDYGNAGTRTIELSIQPDKLLKLDIRNNTMAGSLPDISVCAQLAYLELDDCGFTGPLCDLSKCTLLESVYCNGNGFTGALFDASKCPNLVHLQFGGSQFSGAVPDLSTCLNLVTVALQSNQFTGITLSQRWPLTSTYVRFDSNALTLTAVDAILHAVATDMASRPANGYLYLYGGTNAIPDAAGQADKATIQARPWTCMTN